MQALAFHPQFSWEVPKACELFLPLTQTSLLTGERSTGQLALHEIVANSASDPHAYLRAAANAYKMGQFASFQPGKSRLIAVTLNAGRNRLYLLYFTEQVDTGMTALQVMRFHFDSSTNTIGDFYGELPLPLPETTPITEQPAKGWRDFINFLYVDPIHGGYKGQVVNRVELDKYFFMYVHDEYLYIFYLLYHSQVELNHVPALHQVMTVMHERTGQYLGSYLLTTPVGLEHQEYGETLTLRTGVCLLDQQLIFCNETVDTTKLGWPYLKTPSPLTIPHMPIGYQKYFAPPKRFFTMIPYSSFGTGYVWTRPFSYDWLFTDQYAEEKKFSLLGEVEYEQVHIDKDQLKLYGVYGNKIQQYAIEYIEWYVLDADAAWRPASSLTLNPCMVDKAQEFRVGNRAQHTQLQNLQLRSLNPSIQFSADAVNYSALLNIGDLDPQQQSIVYYVLYTGGLVFNRSFLSTQVEVSYSLVTVP